MRHSEEMLRDYMVAGVHDPRLNPQSIQARHFLIDACVPGRFGSLMEEEYHFAVVMGWLDKVRPDLAGVAHALEHGADNAEGLAIPSVVAKAFRRLPCPAGALRVPNYVRETLDGRPEAMETFAALWREALAGLAGSGRQSVLEPACGSASDYRAFASYGLTQCLDYAGFDLCEKNVRNARGLFPGARFEVGNVFAMGQADRSFDYCVAHDLLEHLSLAGLEQAVSELCRVTRRGICLGFFQMHEGPEHVVRPVEEYHWNLLSLPRVKALLAARGWDAQAVHVSTWLRWRVGCGEDAYYDTAYTLFCERGLGIGNR